jgi:hypothetical protein
MPSSTPAVRLFGAARGARERPRSRATRALLAGARSLLEPGGLVARRSTSDAPVRCSACPGPRLVAVVVYDDLSAGLPVLGGLEEDVCGPEGAGAGAALGSERRVQGAAPGQRPDEGRTRRAGSSSPKLSASPRIPERATQEGASPPRSRWSSTIARFRASRGIRYQQRVAAQANFEKLMAKVNA